MILIEINGVKPLGKGIFEGESRSEAKIPTDLVPTIRRHEYREHKKKGKRIKNKQQTTNI